VIGVNCDRPPVFPGDEPRLCSRVTALASIVYSVQRGGRTNAPGWHPAYCIIARSVVLLQDEQRISDPELDDRPGRARDAYVESQRRWFETLARAARLAVEAGHFRRSLDVDLFAAQFHGILLTYAHMNRIQRDPRAERFARATFDALLVAARRPRRVAARAATRRARRS
jgi:hypothetical protein